MWIKRSSAVKQVNKILSLNFKQWRRNQKIIIPFILSLVSILMLCQRLAGFVRDSGYTINIFEIFICIFNEQYSIVLTSILVITLFHDTPSIDSSTPYYLVRTDCRKWLMAQLIYVGTVSFICIVFVLVSTILSSMDIMYVHNIWSNFSFALSYSSLSEIINVERFKETMSFGSPYHTGIRMMLLIYLYYVVLSLVVVNFNIRGGKRRGSLMGVLFTLFGLILSPSTIKGIFGLDDMHMYKANVLISWISPLNHATFNSHNFGYDSRPTVTESYIVLLALIVMLVVMSFFNIKRYEFDFSDRRD